MDAGEIARLAQDTRWRADEPKRRARAAKVDRLMFWLLIGIPGICILAAIVGPALASLGPVSLLLIAWIVSICYGGARV